MKSWYAIYVRSLQEQKVSERLEENGIQTFLPKIKVVKYYSDRRKTKEEVLFKSYVFVRINLNKMMLVLHLDGVVGFVKFEGKAVPIPDIQIEAVNRFIKDGELELINKEQFLLGDKVEIIKGPFRGQQGRLTRLGQKDIVVLELEVLNRYIPLKIRKNSIKKIQ